MLVLDELGDRLLTDSMTNVIDRWHHGEIHWDFDNTRSGRSRK